MIVKEKKMENMSNQKRKYLNDEHEYRDKLNQDAKWIE